MSGYGSAGDYGSISGLKGHLATFICRLGTAVSSTMKLKELLKHYPAVTGGETPSPQQAEDALKKLFDRYRAHGLYALTEGVDRLTEMELVAVAKAAIEKSGKIKIIELSQECP